MIAVVAIALTLLLLPWQRVGCDALGPSPVADWADIGLVVPSFAAMFATVRWLIRAGRAVEPQADWRGPLLGLWMWLSIGLFVAGAFFVAIIGLFVLGPLGCAFAGL